MTETRMLRYNFTPDEHLANCDELARLFDVQSEVDARNKSIKAQLKEDEETATAAVGRHVRFVRDKYDHRAIDCTWLMDNPAVGQKILMRIDTKDIVEVRRMEDWEKQKSLDLQPVNEELPLEDPAPTETASAPGHSPEAASGDRATPETAGSAAPGPELAPTAAERKKARDEETARKKAIREGTE